MKRLVALALVVFAGCAGDPEDKGEKPKDPPTKKTDPPPAPAYSATRASDLVEKALDRFVLDWQEATDSAGGGQRLVLQNSASADASAWMAFRAPEKGAKPEQQLIEWYLERDEAAERLVDQTPALKAHRAGKPLLAVHRRVWRLGEGGFAMLEGRLKDGLPIATKPGDEAKVEPGKPRPPVSLATDEVVATALSAWNLEVYDPDRDDKFVGLFVQLESSKAFPPSAMPLGAGAKPADLPRKLRVTVVVPDADAASSERVMRREAPRLSK